jgi:N-acetylglucosaminyldiphosphoundecaprenol N-acetyl-beta-D-mannosaminyltransferase
MSTATLERPTAEVLGCRIDPLTMDETLERCAEVIESGEYVQHVCINAAKLVTLQQDEEMREIVANCGLVNADGQAVVWASRILGTPLPERVAGVDLMYRLFALAEQRGYRPYILGAKPEILERAVENLRVRHPRLELAGHRDGYFAPEEQAGVAEEIRRARPDILFVAISSPTKEYFLGEYGEHMGVPFVMGVGGAIDIVGGITKRAPAIWQRLGIEWLYRLLQEPRRMFKRYAVTNARFISLVARALLARFTRGGRRSTGRATR